MRNRSRWLTGPGVFLTALALAPAALAQDILPAEARNLAQVGYDKGVPMGGDPASAPSGKVPSLVIHAARDIDQGRVNFEVLFED